MSNIERWWSGRSLGIVGGLAIVATEGALAYAMAVDSAGPPRPTEPAITCATA